MGTGSETRIGLVGLGRAGGFHLASIRALPNTALTRVYDTDPARAAEVAADFGCPVAADPEEATTSADIDAVVVATPTQTHFGYVESALAAGKPVLSEKPLGTDVAQIDRCFELARSQDVPLLVAFQRRFDPSFAAVAASVRTGEIGALQFIRSVSRDSPVPSLDYLRTSCGIFHDCVVHDFDLVCWIADEEPTEVFAWGSNFEPGIQSLDDFDNVVVSLRFPSGLLANIDVSRQGPHGYDQRLEVLGLYGVAESRNRPQHTVEVSKADGSRRAPIDYSFPTRYAEAYRNEFACFLDCIREGSQPPIRHAEVRLNHRLADAAELSARKGQPVRLDEVDGRADQVEREAR